MSALIRFYPGDRGLEILLVVTLGVTLASGAAWLIARWLARNAALRHVVLFSALNCCLASPAAAWFCATAGLALVSIPILRAPILSGEEEASAVSGVPQAESADAGMCVRRRNN
jgi:hypothetical protein